MGFGVVFSFLLLCSRAFTDVAPYTNDQAYLQGELGPYPTQTFFSNLAVKAPIANIIVEPQDAVSRHRFVTWAAHGDNIVTVPQLLDAATLSVVYQGPQFDEDTFGISQQSCNGTDYLIWWAGTNVEGRAAGNYYIFNSTYHLVWNVSSIGLIAADAHDVWLTPDCNLVFTAYEPKPFELGGFGPNLTDNSWLLDSYFQEINLATNELLFQWRASDHVLLTDSYWPPEIELQGDLRWHGWDYFHINSIQKDHLGNFLVSARHTNALYYINGVTGTIMWTLGGKNSDFADISDGRATDFSWQHDARWLNDDLTRLSLFDDRSCGYIFSKDPISRGIILELDWDDMKVRLESEYRAPDQIVSVRKGGMHYLENGNVLLGFGSEPAFTEYAPNGSILWDVRFGPVMKDIDRETADNYRAYKLDWVGNPHWSPSIAPGPSINGTPVTPTSNNKYHEILHSLSNDTAYLSWNGATRLSKWLILASNGSTDLISVDGFWKMVEKLGFETGVYIGDVARYVTAIAVSADNELLGITPILDRFNGNVSDLAPEVLQAQFMSFKKAWDRPKRHSLLNSAVGLGCGVVSIICACLSWRWRASLRQGLSRVAQSKGYQAVSTAPDTQFIVVPGRRRQASMSSAVDVATSLVSHDLEAEDKDLERGISSRKMVKTHD